MNWIERLYEIKGKDLYSQNGEGLLLEYIWHSIPHYGTLLFPGSVDIGGGDGFYLSNTRHFCNRFQLRRNIFDLENGYRIDSENILEAIIYDNLEVVSIDIDGNDYWVLQKIFSKHKPLIIIAEFNPAFTDSRTIKYNPSHEWAGDDYYGFSFEAGKKLAEKHGYEIIFNVANMNLIMVRKDLINVPVPAVTYKQDNFFKASGRPETDWEFI